jgi:hypothetical protein
MEGLFRVSGSGIEVQRLREQIELRYQRAADTACWPAERAHALKTDTPHIQTRHYGRDYDVCAFDCYAIASCMEAWLSQLPEPIIPESFYNDCVKNANRPDQSLLIIDRIPEVPHPPRHSAHDTTRHGAQT